MNLNEDYLDSCKTILESIVQESEADTRRLKSYDFLDKFEKVLLKEKSSDGRGEKLQRPNFDVVIFTVVPTEFNTLNKILNFVKEKADYQVHGLLYYKFSIKRSNGLDLTGLVTLVGVAGDVNCSIACTRALSAFDCDLAILCGIAAGVKNEAPLYSTVIAQSIVNYEFQRIEKDKSTFRPKIYNVKSYYSNILPSICNDNAQWKDELIENYNKLVSNKSEFPLKKLEKSEFKVGVVASGAKLLADGKTLEMLREEIPIEKGIIAAEMEGSGFAPACEDREKSWLVFRGISDHGAADKNKKINKKYQFMAAASAITSMMRFLRLYYRTPAEANDLEF